MNTETEKAQRASVVAEALSWVGTPYHHHARIKGAGVDCGMVLAEIFERAGVMPAVDPGDYPADWMCHRSEERFLGIVETYAHKIEGLPKPGDIALFQWGRCISHGAIVIEWPQILHAYKIAGGVVLDDAEQNKDLEPRLAGFWSPWGES